MTRNLEKGGDPFPSSDSRAVFANRSTEHLKSGKEEIKWEKISPKKKRMVLTRREFLKASAAGLAGVGTGSYLSTRPAYGQKPIRITCLSLFSGRSAVVGKTDQDGIEMWKDEVNKKGGVAQKKSGSEIPGFPGEDRGSGQNGPRGRGLEGSGSPFRRLQ